MSKTQLKAIADLLEWSPYKIFTKSVRDEEFKKESNFAISVLKKFGSTPTWRVFKPNPQDETSPRPIHSKACTTLLKDREEFKKWVTFGKVKKYSGACPCWGDPYIGEDYYSMSFKIMRAVGGVNNYFDNGGHDYGEEAVTNLYSAIRAIKEKRGYDDAQLNEIFPDLFNVKLGSGY
jgi:hypothetical protein